MPDNFLKRVWTKPPVLFPLVALFHFIITVHAFWTFSDLLSQDIRFWVHPVSLLCYAAAWLLVCDLRKWAAYVYLGLMLVSVLLHYLVPAVQEFTGALFPADLIFSAIILIYFRKFE